MMHFEKNIVVGNKKISPHAPVFIIAEAGVNHGGDIDEAERLIDAAFDAGADAVKFQTFKTNRLILDGVEKAPYQKQTTGKKETQTDMLHKLELSYSQHLELRNYANHKGIIFLSTPFDDLSLDELVKLQVAAIKVASTDITNLPFLRRIAQTGKPIFLSTGMSYMSEVKLALDTIHPINPRVILLQCTANYPIADNEANLRVISTFKNHFDIIVGYSDHTVGVGAAPYAVALGAKVVEKHFTLDKTKAGPDQRMSLDPAELKAFVGETRKVEQYLGSPEKIPTLSETGTRKSLQKCLVTSKAIKKGEIMDETNITAKRTGGQGISPLYYRDVFGKPAPKHFKKEEIIRL